MVCVLLDNDAGGEVERILVVCLCEATEDDKEQGKVRLEMAIVITEGLRLVLRRQL